jgi:hypothetical protein
VIEADKDPEKLRAAIEHLRRLSLVSDRSVLAEIVKRIVELERRLKKVE